MSKLFSMHSIAEEDDMSYRGVGAWSDVDGWDGGSDGWIDNGQLVVVVIGWADGGSDRWWYDGQMVAMEVDGWMGGGSD